MDETRRTFLGATAFGLGALPFAASAVAQTAAAPSVPAAAAPAPAVQPSAYGASTAEKPIKIVSLDRVQEAAKEVLPEAAMPSSRVPPATNGRCARTAGRSMISASCPSACAAPRPMWT